MQPNLVPARLYVILAREAPVGVILRRGPTKWVQLILWHTNNDTFEYGQWFHGRIYERTCDLSPNGSKFVYFGSKYHLERRDDPGYMYEWTAVSRPPYFTALALWSHTDKWQAFGGCFLDNHTLLLHDKDVKPAIGRVPRSLKVMASQATNICKKAQTANGWKVIQERVWQHPLGCAQLEIRKKQNNDKKASILIKTNYYSYRYYVLDEETQVEIALTDVTWADWDHKDRLAFTKEGKLFVGEISDGQVIPKEIADFTSQTFTEVIAPEWARKW